MALLLQSLWHPDFCRPSLYRRVPSRLCTRSSDFRSGERIFLCWSALFVFPRRTFLQTRVSVSS